MAMPPYQRSYSWEISEAQALLSDLHDASESGESHFIGAIVLVREASGRYLIVDGQQRLTSLTQVLKLDKSVATRDEKKRELKLHYYFDIEKALLGPQALEDAIVTVDEQRTQREDFGRKVRLDLSTREKEIAAFHFPCSQILDSSQWEYALVQADREKFTRFMEFRQQVLEPFRNYALPVISLKKETSKEAVCLVFEKVNTGGVPLSVFELITATWAADGFNLRDDWFGGRGKSGRHVRLSKKPLLRDLQPTDFLQGVSLLMTRQRRTPALAGGRSGEEATGVTAFSVGKPSPIMMRAARKELGFDAAHTFMIGDTMSTDILGGAQLGYHTILVLTGGTQREDLDQFAYQPDTIIDSVADLDIGKLESCLHHQATRGQAAAIPALV